MSNKCKLRMILHFSDFEKPYNLKLFDTIKNIEGYELTFETSDEKFNQFNTSLLKEMYILEPNGKIKNKYTINLLRGKNTYHLMSLGGQRELYELLFYDEEKIELIVDGKEIKEYDSLAKFKRFSLINIQNYKIKINGTEINLQNYINFKNFETNSYQTSFYDIQQKFIVSKEIKQIQYMDFFDLYDKHNLGLNNCSSKIDELTENKDEFTKNASLLCEDNKIFFINITKQLNLNLNEKSVKNIINDYKYLKFIYNYIKLRIFLIFHITIKGTYEEFVQIYKYLDDFYKILENDNDCEINEKISVLFHLAELFNEVKSCNSFIKSNFHYIKAKKAENNSTLKLVLEFLEKYINNLNEESPQYFKLIEIDSGIGNYQGSNTYTYDIIDIKVLKNHLKEAIPTIFCFYSNDKSNNLAFTSPEFVGICVNEANLFKYCEKFKIDEDCFNERKYDVKNVAMKLSLNVFHESFGHLKFQIHNGFCFEKLNSTPRKCFENKKLKKLVEINKPIKNNTINILTCQNKSDRGNYLESSFGKLPGNMYYTSVYLQELKNIGNLLDHPELFYNKDNLEILQKYIFYKYVFEKKNEKKENKNKDEEDEEKKYKEFSFKDEFEFLTSFFTKNQNDLMIFKDKEKAEAKSSNRIYIRKVLKIKRKISNVIRNSEPMNKTIDIKKENKIHSRFKKLTDRNKIIDIILTKNLNSSQKNYYFKMLFDNLHKN